MKNPRSIAEKLKMGGGVICPLKAGGGLEE
jgi:hypothetical protein